MTEIKPLIKHETDATFQCMINAQTFADLNKIIANCDSEIGFLATGKKIIVDQKDSRLIIYYIDELFIPEQTVNGVECELKAESIMQVVSQHITKGGSPNDFRVWIHSHVNMGCNPSGTDTTTFNEHIKESEEWYMMVIINKKGNIAIHIADKKENVYIQDIPLQTYSAIVMSEVKDKLKPIAKAVYSYNRYWENDHVLFNENDDLPSYRRGKTFTAGKEDLYCKSENCGAMLRFATEKAEGICNSCSIKKARNADKKAKNTFKAKTIEERTAMLKCEYCTAYSPTVKFSNSAKMNLCLACNPMRGEHE
jgi:Zn finger protein HypA/HybF involved in hydrogenase expression